MEAFLLEYITFFIAKNRGSYTFSNEYHPFPYTFSSESNAYHTKVLCFYDRFSIIKHPLGNKNYTANHRNPKKTTTFAFNKRSVTYLRKCPITQYLVSDNGHSTKKTEKRRYNTYMQSDEIQRFVFVPTFCVFVKTEVVPIKMNGR